jgi:predicted permease
MALALLCSRFWIRPQLRNWTRPAQGTFSLATMLGNTGYIGFPVVLLLPQLGPDYFGWALFYDVLGTILGAYVVGVILAARFSQGATATPSRWQDSLGELIKNPTILAFVLGLALRPVPFPGLLDMGLSWFAWSMVMLSLALMGMRLQQLKSWGNLKPAMAAVGIRMVLLPLVIGMGLTAAGMVGPSRLVMVLQAGMPSAFATLVLSETYNLDRELAVTCVGVSSVLLLLTLPLWLWGFCTW